MIKSFRLLIIHWPADIMKTKDKSFLILAFAVITLLEIFLPVRGCSPDPTGVECPEHTCNDNKKCYTHAQQCDDHKDCDDNTDEDVGHCGKKICQIGSEAYYSKYST